MELKYATSSQEIKDIKERIASMSLAYKEVIQDDLLQPVIMDGKERHEGFVEIHTFLDQLEIETKLWWYCDC